MNEHELIVDDLIPKSLTIENTHHILMSLMNNLHYRALYLPVGGGTPKWVSNSKLVEYLSRS